MSVTGDQIATTEKYRPLDTSRNEIRLLSFDTTTKYGPIRLNLHHVSLDDWKPEYVTFRNQNASKHRSELSEEWSERDEFALSTPPREVYESVSRFIWGDYISLSYTWGDCEGEKATIFLDGVATGISKHLEGALKDLRSSFECQYGMKVWVDALCIDQASNVDRNQHILRIKDIFGLAFSVSVWTKEGGDLHYIGLQPPGEHLLICEDILRGHGRRVLEELLGVRDRDWGAAEAEDRQLKNAVEDIDCVAFCRYDYYAHPVDDDEDPSHEIAELVITELLFMFQKKYWSRLWVIQELAVSPTSSMVHWGDSVFYLSTLQTVSDILLSHSAFGKKLIPGIWDEVKLKLDLLTFATKWKALEASGEPDSSQSTLVRQLRYLAQSAKCSVQLDEIYGLLGLFPPAVSNAVTVDYNSKPADVIAEFVSAFPEWIQD